MRKIRYAQTWFNIWKQEGNISKSTQVIFYVTLLKNFWIEMDQMEQPLFDPISIPWNGKGTYSCDVKQESDLIKSFDVNDSRFERAKLKKFSCVNKSSAKCLRTMTSQVD